VDNRGDTTWFGKSKLTKLKAETEKIACIGWGSLVPNPGSLPIDGSWRNDGPQLRVEFARESAGHHMTLVICSDVESVPPVSTYWTLLEITDMDAARKALGLREYADARDGWIARHIGFWDARAGRKQGACADSIASWGAEKKLRGAVWTDLPYGFIASRNLMPSADEVLAHLQKLAPDKLAIAKAYVEIAPNQTDTPFRRRFAKDLGWIGSMAKAE
jgi:hypothetical protein